MRAILPLIVLITGFLQLSGKPNILLIMADDMGYSDLGCFGGEIQTPSLDSLAENGIRFTNFYSENMCWVSRASIMTGVYHRVSPKSSFLHPRCLTLPEALKDNGYRTGMMGSGTSPEITPKIMVGMRFIPTNGASITFTEFSAERVAFMHLSASRETGIPLIMNS